MAIHLKRSTHLLDDPLVHDGDTVADRQGLALVVGDIHRGDSRSFLDGPDRSTHLDAKLRVQVGKGLVHQQHVGLDDDGPGKGDTLLLAAGHVLGLPVAKRGNLHHVEHLLHAPCLLRILDVPLFQTERHILERRHMGEHGIVLEDHADVPLVAGDVVDALPVEEEIASLDGIETGNHAQQRGLAASRRAEQREELTLLDVQAQIRNDDIPAICLARMRNVDRNTHRHAPRSFIS